jgi:hypothetical protein
MVTQKRTPSPFGKQRFPTLGFSGNDNNNTLEPINDVGEKNIMSSGRAEVFQAATKQPSILENQFIYEESNRKI